MPQPTTKMVRSVTSMEVDKRFPLAYSDLEVVMATTSLPE
jgi:hypothetical protein